MSRDFSAKLFSSRRARGRQRLLNLQRPWTGWDGLLSVYLIIAIPLTISLWLLASFHLGWLSSKTYSLITGNSVIASAVALLLGLIVEFGLLYYFSRRYKLTVKSFGLRKFSYKKAILMIITFYLLFVVAVYLVYLLVAALAPQINLDQSQKVGFEFGQGGGGLIISGLVTVVFAPLIEEIYFRGFLLPAFSKKSFMLGAVLSSMFFGLLHFQVNVAIYTFVFGLFLSYMYYRLGSIVPGIFLHIVNNLVAFLLLLSLH